MVERKHENAASSEASGDQNKRVRRLNTPLLLRDSSTPQPSPRQSPGSPTPPRPTPRSPTPRSPTPRSPTPRSPTPHSPTPPRPTPRSPTPHSPTPPPPTQLLPSNVWHQTIMKTTAITINLQGIRSPDEVHLRSQGSSLLLDASNADINYRWRANFRGPISPDFVFVGLVGEELRIMATAMMYRDDEYEPHEYPVAAQSPW
ncbi:hypothetical protein PLEOSDRAFT_172829, partial [Pleurotus ostreatus PC15]